MMRKGRRTTMSFAYLRPISALNRYVTYVSLKPSTLSGIDPSRTRSKGYS